MAYRSDIFDRDGRLRWFVKPVGRYFSLSLSGSRRLFPIPLLPREVLAGWTTAPKLPPEASEHPRVSLADW